MSGRSKWIRNYRPSNTKVTAADNNVVAASGKGELAVRFHLPNGKSRHDTLKVLHVPALGTTNLLSVKQTVKGGRYMTFNEMGCELRNRFGALMAMGDLDEDGMYNLKMTPTEVLTHRKTEMAMNAVDID